MSDVTFILSKIEAGDQQAAAELLPLVYAELRKLAAQRMVNERASHTLQATALVHEAYVRLVDSDQVQDWDSRGHFFSAAAEAMRRILVEHARAKSTLKRGGDAQRVELDDMVDSNSVIQPDQVLDLDDALQKLEKEDSLIAELVRLRLYAGLSVTEASNIMGVSRSTAYEYWDYALSWFSVELGS